jgi:hypothetical protein
MSRQYRTSASDQPEAEMMATQLTQQLENFLDPLLTRLDAYLDARLVRTFLLSLAAILTFRNLKQGLCLSELGSYILSPAQAPAGTKRLSHLLHSKKWEKTLLERFLWEKAEKKIDELREEKEEILCIWDSSVIEKPESEHTEGMCAVRSSKARRLKKQRKGNWNPAGGKAITVLGVEWITLLIVGMHGIAEVANMRWWTRKGKDATSQQEEEKHILWERALCWRRTVIHVFDRGYASKRWLQQLHTFDLRFVIRWKKGHLFLDQQGKEKKLWEIARGKRSWGHRDVWDEGKHAWCKTGVVAIPLRHAGYAGDLWVVVGRRKGEPWYLITNERVETEEQAWRIIFIYARRWQVELAFRYGKSELAMESPRLERKEERDKLLLMVTLVYIYLLSLIDPSQEHLKEWLLRHYCHRTGKRCRVAKVPLYRLRWAMSRFWQEFHPVFHHALFKEVSREANIRSETLG